MIQKIIITIVVIFIFILGISLLKKIKAFNHSNNYKNKNEENIVDLEKDPKTNEYKPK